MPPVLLTASLLGFCKAKMGALRARGNSRDKNCRRQFLSPFFSFFELTTACKKNNPASKDLTRNVWLFHKYYFFNYM